MVTYSLHLHISKRVKGVEKEKVTMNIGRNLSGDTSNNAKILISGSGPWPKKGKDQRDEDLVLFREMFKQERASAISLLQPESVEFEANYGNYQFYKQTSGRKGYEFIPDSGKSDYDWLKTPPATPLFASLEMEPGVKSPELVLQREIPIIQHLSRFSGNPVPSENSSSAGKSKSPKPKPITEDLLVVPNVNLKSIKTNVAASETKSRSIKFKNPNMSVTQKPSAQTNTSSKRISMNSTTTKASAKLTNRPQKKVESPNPNFLTSDLSKSMSSGSSESTTSKSRSRGVSPLVRSTINLAVISDVTPPNLKADRSLSTTRDRSMNRSCRRETTPLKRESIHLKAQLRSSSVSITESNNSKAQPRSSSASFTRKVEQKQETNKMQSTGGKGTHVLGSRMVDRFMSSRKSSTTTTISTIVEDKEMKIKPINMRALLNEGLGFGGRVSKSSLDGAFKHMELK